MADFDSTNQKTMRDHDLAMGAYMYIGLPLPTLMVPPPRLRLRTGGGMRAKVTFQNTEMTSAFSI